MLSLATLWCMGLAAQLPSVTGVIARGYDSHVELRWDQIANPAVRSVRVFGAREGEDFERLGEGNLTLNRFIDFVGEQDVTTRYYLRTVDRNGRLGTPSDTVTAATFALSDSALLTMVQEYTFRYFYDFGHPVSGMARERNTTSIVTTGGTGFGLMALIVGAERGFVTYEEALARTNKIVDFLMTVPRFRGAFSHWLNGGTGEVVPFSELDDGGDLVETAFLLQGLLTSRQYFDGDGEDEIRLRDNVNQLYSEVDWNFYRKQVENVLTWHWSPIHGFAIDLPVRGFNETHIVYILAAAAPNPAFRIPPALYHTGWAGGDYETDNVFYDIPLLVGRDKGGPLFFSHYSYLGFDPRGKRDRYVNYFRRNTNHTLINYNHALDNPYDREGYGPNVWGITASDDPDGYLAHAPDNPTLDNGTIAPTAALGSMPYTPEESMAALKHFYRELGDRMWGPYGFYDAFNLERNWFADSYLAIDQGPIINMIENHRSGLLWELFMSSPEIAPALKAVGFVEDSTTTSVQLPSVLAAKPSVYPNPAGAGELVTLEIELREPAVLGLELVDALGRVVEPISPNQSYPAGVHRIPLHLRPRPLKNYFVRLITAEDQLVIPILLN